MIDEATGGSPRAIESDSGVRVAVTDTIMTGDEAAASLARTALAQVARRDASRSSRSRGFRRSRPATTWPRCSPVRSGPWGCGTATSWS